jgi:hypothetical protein
MKIWATVKCFFGFCAEKQEIEMREKLAIDATYKVEPVVKTLDASDVKTPDIKEIIKIKDEFGKALNDSLEIKVTDTKDISETGNVRAKIKVKRHWYNNGKTQKLVPEGEEKALPKTWKKGCLKKSEKKDK